MKRVTLFAVAAALLLASCNSQEKADSKDVKEGTGDTTSTVKIDDHKWVMPDTATIRKNWQAYMTPGTIHSMIASWNGNWSGDIKMWETPGAAPQESKGTASNKMIMGGRYQLANYTGTMMNMPFEGMGLLGYDNTTKKFNSTWIDNMGTGVMNLTGTWDEGSKSITLTGQTVNPITGDGKLCDVREVFKVIDNDNQLMEMYSYTPDGVEFKSMEIKYTRKK